MPRAVNLADRFKILARDNFRCVYCGATPQDRPLHIDHVHPRSKGGADELSNYVTACFDCNVGKNDVILDEILGRKEFSNREWRADKDGLEHIQCGYFIEQDRFNEKATYIAPWMSDWLAHIAEKPFNLEPFIEAFYQAFAITATPIRFDWRKSVKWARAKKAYSDKWEAEFDRRLKDRYGKEPTFFRASDFDLMDDYEAFSNPIL